MKKLISVVSTLALAMSASPAWAQEGMKVEQLEQQNWPTIQLGRVVSGQITTSDVLRDDKTYTDGFWYNAQAGETVTITQRSGDFDSWVILDDPNGETYKYNDDGAGGRDARIVFTFPHAGRYMILANNVAPGSTGAYTLEVVRGSLPIANAAPPAVVGTSTTSASEWASLAQRLFEAAGTKFAERGYGPTSFTHSGQLNNNASDRFPVHLSGQQTQILGACDNDCKNIDMQLLDSRGNVVGEDVENDDFPIVSTSNQSGDYTIVVKMVSCAAAPCHYAVKMWAKQ